MNHKKTMLTLTRWGPVILWMAVIYAVSSDSYPYRIIPPEVSITNETIGRIAHIIEYAILAVLTGRAVISGRTLTSGGIIKITLISSSYGLFDELHQNLVPERSFQFLDLGLDVVGILLGIGIIACYFSLISK